MSASQLVREADNLIKAGDECASTGLFKWSPDWDGALLNYKDASLKYKNAKSWEAAISAYRKLGHVQVQLKQFFSAGKSMEEAAGAAQQIHRPDIAMKLFEQAASHYSNAGNMGKTAEAYSNAAETIRPSNVEAATLLLQKAAEYCVLDDVREGPQILQKLIELLIEQKKFIESLPVIEKKIEVLESRRLQHYVNKAAMYSVVICLANNDSVKARRMLDLYSSKYQDFCLSNEWELSSSIISAFEANDGDKMMSQLKKNQFLFVDPAIGDLLRDISKAHQNTVLDVEPQPVLSSSSAATPVPSAEGKSYLDQVWGTSSSSQDLPDQSGSEQVPTALVEALPSSAQERPEETIDDDSVL